MDFKRDLFVQIEQDFLKLTEDDLTLLIFLESIFKLEFIPFPDVTSSVKNDLQHFGRRNL